MPPLLANLFWDAFNHSSLINQMIVGGLIAASLYFWTIMLSKFGDLKIINNNNRKFFNPLKKHLHPAQHYIDTQGNLTLGTPMASIYGAAMKELTTIMRRKGYTDDQITDHPLGAFDITLTDTEMAAVRVQTEGELSEQIIVIEDKLSTIGTFTVTAPSVGLFGTVLGVMEAFMAMATSGSAMINSVAPGISGALLTTVLGLFIAIPSSIGYNMLSARIRATSVKTENFTDELLANIARTYTAQNEVR